LGYQPLAGLLATRGWPPSECIFLFFIIIINRGTHLKFAFLDVDSTSLENPWRESFKTVYRGMHVRPGAATTYRNKPPLVARARKPPAHIMSPPLPSSSAGAGAPSSGITTEIPTPPPPVRPGRRITHFETLTAGEFS
jgi:hypothetical protein